eukprot:1932441-Alexandrium_andersonii.AAC.1
MAPTGQQLRDSSRPRCTNAVSGGLEQFSFASSPGGMPPRTPPMEYLGACRRHFSGVRGRGP